jgi:hypothetical protein
MARPPGTSRAGWVSLQVGVLFLSSSALVSGIALLLAITLWRPQQQPAPLSRPEARLLAGLAALAAAGASGEPAWSEEARLARAGGERPEWWRSRPPGA